MNMSITSNTSRPLFPLLPSPAIKFIKQSHSSTTTYLPRNNPLEFLIMILEVCFNLPVGIRIYELIDYPNRDPLYIMQICTLQTWYMQQLGMLQRWNRT